MIKIQKQQQQPKIYIYLYIYYSMTLYENLRKLYRHGVRKNK